MSTDAATVPVVAHLSGSRRGETQRLGVPAAHAARPLGQVAALAPGA